MKYLVSDEVSSAPDIEPVELFEFKQHSRIDYDDENGLIEQYLMAARQHVEEIAGRALITQTREARLSRWLSIWIETPSPSVQSITAVKYLDSDRAEQTVDASTYYVDRLALPWSGASIIPPTSGWPNLVDVSADPIRVTYVCGFGDSPEDVPETLRQAVRLLAAHWFEHREAVAAGVTFSAVPMAVKSLLEPWRYRRHS